MTEFLSLKLYIIFSFLPILSNLTQLWIHWVLFHCFHEHSFEKKMFAKDESKPSYKLIHVEQYFWFRFTEQHQHDFGSYQVWKWHVGNFRPALASWRTQVYSDIVGGGWMEGNKTYASTYETHACHRDTEFSIIVYKNNFLMSWTVINVDMTFFC